jgi:hypothetical protein
MTVRAFSEGTGFFSLDFEIGDGAMIFDTFYLKIHAEPADQAIFLQVLSIIFRHANTICGR